MTLFRDLALGVRFAFSGGREGWTRTALTALGVGIGVALLLAAAAVPNMTASRTDRANDRMPANAWSNVNAPRTEATYLWIDATTEFHGDPVGGDLLRADGPNAPRPPGAATFPGPGDMVVSPALRRLIDSPQGTLLRERLPFRVVGAIAPAGLLDPGELYYYAGDSALALDRGAYRAASFGYRPHAKPFSPLLTVTIALICVVLLVPVGVFIATAVRFGGERRDRRLAALRLVGADARSARRMAAGEALLGAALGIVTGAVLFAVGRQFAGDVRLWGFSVFPSDVAPAPALAALVVVAVLGAAVVVTLLALRAVSIEPLGVVRNTRPRRRRLWWRLVLPAIGLATLGAMDTVGDKSYGVDPYPVAAGATFVLVGLVGLLPWLIEKTVARLRGGPVPWQLAVRRLQLSTGSAAQAVGGITVAVAGAVALQMMFGGIQDDFAHPTGSTGHAPTASAEASHGVQRQSDASVSVAYGDTGLAVRMADRLRGTTGVSAAAASVYAYVNPVGASTTADVPPTTALTVGDCTSLEAYAHITSCHDGDVFVSHYAANRRMNGWVDKTAHPGRAVLLDNGDPKKAAHSARWTLSASARTVIAVPGPLGERHAGILATPGAISARLTTVAETDAEVWTDQHVPDASEHVRTAAAGADPSARVRTAKNVQRDKQYTSVQNALRLGGTATLAMIAASLLVAQAEQLRERRRLLSVLVAFGTRRSTLAWSVLWQTAVPVIVGTALAVAGGLALGRVMLGVVAKPVDSWWVFWPYAITGAAVILVVTLASLPPLWRLMRAEGLRTE